MGEINYNVEGRVIKTKIFYLDDHKITQVKIRWVNNPFWPQCFTWIDNREWPYRDSNIKGHSRFPEKYWIRRVIRKWYGEENKDN